MNKSELIDAIAARTELSKVASGKALDAVIESIIQAVAKGDGVSLVGFGSFKAAARAAREGKNESGRRYGRPRCRRLSQALSGTGRPSQSL